MGENIPIELSHLTQKALCQGEMRTGIDVLTEEITNMCKAGIYGPIFLNKEILKSFCEVSCDIFRIGDLIVPKNLLKTHIIK